MMLPFHRALAEGQAQREGKQVLTELHNKEVLEAEKIIETRENRSYCL